MEWPSMSVISVSKKLGHKARQVQEAESAPEFQDGPRGSLK